MLRRYVHKATVLFPMNELNQSAIVNPNHGRKESIRISLLTFPFVNDFTF